MTIRHSSLGLGLFPGRGGPVRETGSGIGFGFADGSGTERRI